MKGTLLDLKLDGAMCETCYRLKCNKPLLLLLLFDKISKVY